jgi:hypothetical protein
MLFGVTIGDSGRHVCGRINGRKTELEYLESEIESGSWPCQETKQMHPHHQNLKDDGTIFDSVGHNEVHGLVRVGGVDAE